MKAPTTDGLEAVLLPLSTAVITKSYKPETRKPVEPAETATGPLTDQTPLVAVPEERVSVNTAEVSPCSFTATDEEFLSTVAVTDETPV